MGASAWQQTTEKRNPCAISLVHHPCMPRTWSFVSAPALAASSAWIAATSSRITARTSASCSRPCTTAISAHLLSRQTYEHDRTMNALPIRSSERNNKNWTHTLAAKPTATHTVPPFHSDAAAACCRTSHLINHSRVGAPCNQCANRCRLVSHHSVHECSLSFLRTQPSPHEPSLNRQPVIACFVCASAWQQITAAGHARSAHCPSPQCRRLPRVTRAQRPCCGHPKILRRA